MIKTSKINLSISLLKPSIHITREVASPVIHLVFMMFLKNKKTKFKVTKCQDFFFFAHCEP